MRQSRSSTNNKIITGAKGMNKLVALVMLLPLAFVEFLLVVYAIFNGFRALGLPLFIFSLWNLAACVALTVYIFTHKKLQASGHMEVSNYLNLNKMGRDKL